MAIPLQTVGSPRRILDPSKQQDHRELFAELREISREISDPALARRRERASQGLSPREAPLAPDSPTLCPRELDVLAQVALGKKNGTVARPLRLTEGTVKSYGSSAMRMLEAGSRYEAVVAAGRDAPLSGHVRRYAGSTRRSGCPGSRRADR